MDEKNLTKAQAAKLRALKKLVRDDLGREAFGLWLEQQARAVHDPVAEKIEAALVDADLAEDRKFNLGRYGYTVRRARGKGASGFAVARNGRPTT